MASRRELTDKDLELGQPPYLVDTFLSDKINLLVSDPKTAKSITAIYLSLCVASRKDFLGFSTRQGPVCYINNEMPSTDEESDLTRWIDKFKLGLNIHDIPFYAFSYEFTDLTNPRQASTLLERCNLLGATFLVIDNLGASIGGQREDNPVMQKLFLNLVPLVQQSVAVLGLHHNTKDGSIYRGASSILASVDRICTTLPISYRDRQTRDINGELMWLDPDTPNMSKVLKDFAIKLDPKFSRGETPYSFLIGIEENDKTGAAKLVSKGLFRDADPTLVIQQRMLQLLGVNLGQGFTDRTLAEGIGDEDIRLVRETRKILVERGELEYRVQGKKLLIFESGVTATEPVVEGFQETLWKAIDTLCLKYRSEKQTNLLILEAFTKPLVAEIPDLAKLSNPKDNKLIGPSKRISIILREMGFEVYHHREGSHVLLEKNKTSKG